MSEPLLAVPRDGWTVDDLDQMPQSDYRYELTDGALSVTPSPSNLHQTLLGMLFGRLVSALPEPHEVAMGVEIRFSRQLTRIPDLMVVHSEEPGRHWFAPAEVVLAVEIESPGNHVEDRITKPGLYAQFRIPHYWRIEPRPLRTSVYRLGEGDTYTFVGTSSRLDLDDPFEVHLDLADLLPRWAK